MGDLPNNPDLQNPEEFQQQQQQQQYQQEQEEAEEALSLCDLPLSLNNKENTIFDNNNHNHNSNDSIDFFEFFSDLSYSENMCSAEDIIFCGKLIPFKEQQFSHPTPQTPKITNENQTKQTSLRRRSESLSKLQSPVTRSNSINTKFMRNSRSLDYRKLNPVSNSPPETIERNSSVKSVGNKSEISLKKAPSSRPRWYLFMFGMVKFPTEMELSDIKNRQVRRNQQQSMIFPVNRSSVSSKGSGSWKLLKALSCKDHASVAVTASFCVPRV